MPISPTSAPASAAAASAASGQGAFSKAGSKEMGKEAFLQLLVAQLGNQDPMNPMKGQEFAAQLAQFSSLEQLTNISGQMEQQQGDSTALMQSVNSGVAAGLIGRSVEAAGNTVEWTGEGEATLGLDLSAPASEVTVKIRNAAGSVVHSQTLENVSAGAEEIRWSGTTEDGSRLPKGTYSFDVTATDGEGNPVEAGTYIGGTVDRVTFGQEGTLLWVNGTKVPMGQVRSVGTGPAA